MLDNSDNNYFIFVLKNSCPEKEKSIFVWSFMVKLCRNILKEFGKTFQIQRGSRETKFNLWTKLQMQTSKFSVKVIFDFR